jgi:hypothetical protein|tara:strand:+ start:3627 stop:3830 length:204 start_codon:yes stop_codon:yes gene_type:complete
MSTNEWAGLAVATATIVASFAGSVRWLVKHYLTELKPNSGSSMRDSLDRLERRVDSLYELVAGKSNE